jgi:prepilin-type N-terminal cleavage/methylation domain-containing protein
MKNTPMNSKKKFAFTLAEVLITIGIIGVVAAMTIPNLMTAYKAQKLRTQFLKAYSTLAQTFRRMEADDVNTDMRSSEYSANRFYKTFAKYVTGTTVCSDHDYGSNTKVPDGCYSYRIYQTYDEATYKTLSRASKIRDGLFNNGELMLPDSTLIFFDDSPESEGWIGVTIYVDINGYKNPPNLLGYDFFVFEVVDGTVRPMGDINTTCYANKVSYCTSYLGMNNTIQAVNDTDYFKKIVKNYK